MAVPQKVVIGAPMREFVGGSFNALVEGYWQQRAGGGKQRGARSGSPGPALTVLVKNSSGAAREPGHVLGLDNLVLTLTEEPSQVYREPILNGITPTTADHANKFVVCKDHIADGEVGRAWLHGCGWVRANITDTGHTALALADGVADYLASATSGFELVWVEAGTGTKWALVLLGGGGGGSADVAYRVAKVTAEITAATDDLPENWGTGTGQPYDFSLGYIDEGAAAIELHNMLPFPILENAWVKYSVVYVGGAIAAYVNLVDNATCYEYPWHVEA